MAELFDYRQDRWAPELRSIGFHLGKFIYLLDAYATCPATSAGARTTPCGS